MTIHTLAALIDIPQEKLDYWTTCSPRELITDMDYINLLLDLNKPLLERTLSHAYRAYEEALPHFQRQLYVRYNIQQAPMFSQSMANWVMSIIEYPQYIQKIIQYHHNLPVEVLEDGLAMVLDILSHMHEGREEWQRAICVICLPLILPNRTLTTTN